MIGVLKSKGAAAFGNDQDEIVIVPLKMFQTKIKGDKDISSILISNYRWKIYWKCKTEITFWCKKEEL